ncbi:hypothetical protein EI94DRAFT_1697229 [Lactarius quietus]|nr:hypothetical protein EI94DRAFT_1697229 [Lactarius quietus]
MEGAKKHLCMNTSNVTPESIEQWDICKIMNSVSSNTPPSLTSVLNADCESKASHARAKTAKSKNQGTALADHSVERAWPACLHPHALVYDNINVSSLIFVKQGPNMMSKVPLGHRTVFYPLCVSTIEEASVVGNLLVHDDIYLVQLKRSSDDLNQTAIPSFNDQLTNAHIHGGQNIHQQDNTHWEHCQIFQLAFGTFHLTMNLIWSILETHRGSISKVGSLTHLITVLEKTHLGGEHPDYHTLLSTLRQILDGLILNACVPTVQLMPVNPKYPPKELESGEVELVDATAARDFGRIEDILPPLACIF